MVSYLEAALSTASVAPVVQLSKHIQESCVDLLTKNLPTSVIDCITQVFYVQTVSGKVISEECLYQWQD